MHLAEQFDILSSLQIQAHEYHPIKRLHQWHISIEGLYVKDLDKWLLNFQQIPLGHHAP